MAAPVLDTHAWIWWIDQDPRLGRHELDALDRLPVDDRPCVCAISLWEAATLVERGRLTFNVPLNEWLALAAHPKAVRILPITPDIAAMTAVLPASFHRDPADRLIVATCRVLRLPLLTHDRAITRAKLVPRWSPT